LLFRDALNWSLPAFMLKIATLIPAVRTRFLERSLKCLSSQSYRNFDCYLSDDSVDYEVTALAEALKHNKVINFSLKTMPGPRVGLAVANIRMLLSEIKEEYDLVHLFFDDDIIGPDFYKAHADLHQRIDVRVSASARSLVNELGHPIARARLPEKVGRTAKKQVVVTDSYLANTMIPTINNWVGEYSNMVFRGDCLDYFGMTGWTGLHYGLGDVSCPIFAGPRLGYIPEILGSFTIHNDSMTSDYANPSRKCSVLAWPQIALDALNRSLISEECARACIKVVREYNLNVYSSSSDMMRFQVIFDNIISARSLDFSEFSKEWQDFIRNNFPHLEI